VFPPVLGGLRVLVTRPARDQGDKWAAALSAAGAVVIPYPTIEILPPPSFAPLDQALAQISRYDWIIFTSQPAVFFVASRMQGGRFPPGLNRPRVAAVGTETARALEGVGAQVDLVPADQRQEGLMAGLRDAGPGTRLLFPQACGGRAALAEALRGQGCQVDVVPAYQTNPISRLPPLPAFDVATFSSPSALRAFVDGHGVAALAARTVAVIGRTTAAEAMRHSLSPVISTEPNIDALISAIASACSSRGGP